MSDWPGNNYWTARERTNTVTGFKFYPWDGDFSLRTVTMNNTGVSGGVATPYNACRNSQEFRVLFGDHVQRHFFNGGALYTDVSRPAWDPLHPERNLPAARFARLCDGLFRPLVAESARWGDVRRSIPYTRDSDWVPVKNDLLSNFFPQRYAIVMQQLRSAGLYPAIDAPVFNQFGGGVPPGFSLIVTNPNVAGGTIFYTLDGSDPRLLGGAINPAAVAYDAPLTLNRTTEVSTRVRSAGTTWSALTRGSFYVLQDFTKLRITEIMYNPPAFGLIDGDEVEFLELKNTGTNALDLGGLSFLKGITFAFTNNTILAPGAFFVLARNALQFAAKYPGVPVNGIYSGRLDNQGETLTLAHFSGAVILSVTYNDHGQWPVAPDGYGFSLVPINASNPDSDNGAYWRASAVPGGSPGADDLSPSIAPAVINEILATPISPERAAIELFNPNSTEVNVGGWFLSDDGSALKKFRIPDNTMIAGRGYRVFDETSFNAVPGLSNSISLRPEGGQIYLISAAPAGQLTGYSYFAGYGASEAGVSLGRYVNSVGDEDITPQVARSIGSTNAGPRIGPVIINEIYYHSDVFGDEFIELRNISGKPVPLFEPNQPTNTWRLNGANFSFPSQVTLAATGLVLIVASDPVAFRYAHLVPGSVPIFGPYTGLLQNSGERLQLQKPGPTNALGALSYIDVDVVRYNDRAPWPPAADGAGASLQRRNVFAYANDPTNWDAALPTPGRDLSTGGPPVITQQPASVSVLGTGNASFSVMATGAPPLFYQWRWNGASIPSATNTTFSLTNVQLAQAGNYSVIVFNEGGAVESSLANLAVLAPAFISTHPSNIYVRLQPDPQAAPSTNVMFTVAATSSSPIRYQWRFNGTNILNATQTFLTISNVQLENEGYYAVALTDNNGTILSSNAYLQPLITPVIRQQPVSQRVAVGSQFTLSVVVSGHPKPIGYRWRRGGFTVATNVSMETNDFLTFTAFPTVATQSFNVVITNAANIFGILSSTATITTLADADGDGLPDEWEIQFGLNPTNSLDRNLDLDGDGVSNWQEYFSGTAPNDPLSYLRVDLSKTNNTAVIQFSGAAEKTYTVQFKDALKSGPWSRLADVPAQTDGHVEVLYDFSWRSNRFYRVVTPKQP